MSPDEFSKASCPECGQHLEFPATAAGQEISCPGCSAVITLVASESADQNQSTPPDSPVTREEVDASFVTGVHPGDIPTPARYKFGLLLAAFALVMVPVLYAGLIGAILWCGWWWATHINWFFGGTRRIPIVLIGLYYIPVLIALILAWFLASPLFRKREKPPQQLAINPDAEPVLYHLIARIAQATGAPMPSRIDLDCTPNAAAGFRDSHWGIGGRDLVLVLGIPLVSQLTITQLAGIVAHEFGHFTQGAGMRMTCFVRQLNMYLAELVYSRAETDTELGDDPNEQQGPLEWMIVSFALFGAWVSKQVLKLLLLASSALCGFTLRQMEYDADRVEARLVGAREFTAASEVLRRCHAAIPAAYKAIRTMLQINRRAPDDFAHFLGTHIRHLTATQLRRFDQWEEQSNVFSTHPRTTDRIQAVESLGVNGIFRLDRPATDLFSDFDILSRQITHEHYEDDLGLEMGLVKLFSIQEEERRKLEQNQRVEAEQSATPSFRLPNTLGLKKSES